ncbi:hypothetical protein E2C01_074090 [Portunus trituberculatus]|uniref:Uncharacterized protein n=1 Tax=Portunus trituberculatus TaxID=210409 RepID=A0A5B7ICF5_PORTR|nr:hypothetical protein [Portunus trituberculatus]
MTLTYIGEVIVIIVRVVATLLIVTTGPAITATPPIELNDAKYAAALLIHSRTHFAGIPHRERGEGDRDIETGKRERDTRGEEKRERDTE